MRHLLLIASVSLSFAAVDPKWITDAGGVAVRDGAGKDHSCRSAVQLAEPTPTSRTSQQFRP